MLSPLVKEFYVLIDDGSVCTEAWGECIKAIGVANRQLKRKREFFSSMNLSIIISFKHQP